MKAIMVMFDSLSRNMLKNYGCNWTITPNFNRLAEKTICFENSFVGSMPCMPARRELHTGRYNFLHRSWGPLEPFDVSMPEILKNNKIYTHLVSDHSHYWEEGGCTYHTKYSTWEGARGQEGDFWKGEVAEPQIPQFIGNGNRPTWKQDWVNRKYMTNEEEQPQAKTFKAGIEFIETNYKEDNWFLQIETFDPHEPFYTQEKYKELYKHEYNGRHFDWPDYDRVKETPEEVQHLRYEYAALLSMCDAYLGKVLDKMDQYNMWEDTMLIVNTDHGFLLGEHEWWGKVRMPFYNEVARTPLYIWDPRVKKKGEIRKALVQTIDLAPTVLEFFNIDIPREMQGIPLKRTIENDEKIREAALFGVFGGHVNCTDGRYVYMRGPSNPSTSPIYEYTIMPTHMRTPFTINELKTAEFKEAPFSFTKGCGLLKIDAKANGNFAVCERFYDLGTKLFDIEKDAAQEYPLEDKEIEEMMIKHMVKLMEANEAPEEIYERMGLSEYRERERSAKYER